MWNEYTIKFICNLIIRTNRLLFPEPPVESLFAGSDDDVPVGVIIGIIAAILAFIFIIICIQWQRSKNQERTERIIDSIYADNRR